jgi:hypothetical protein
MKLERRKKGEKSVEKDTKYETDVERHRENEE